MKEALSRITSCGANLKEASYRRVQVPGNKSRASKDTTIEIEIDRKKKQQKRAQKKYARNKSEGFSMKHICVLHWFCIVI